MSRREGANRLDWFFDRVNPAYEKQPHDSCQLRNRPEVSNSQMVRILHFRQQYSGLVMQVVATLSGRSSEHLPFDLNEVRLTLKILSSDFVTLIGVGITSGFIFLAIVTFLTDAAILPYNP